MDAVSSEAVAPATPSMPSTSNEKDYIGPGRVRSVLAEGTPFGSASTGWPVLESPASRTT